ncbi:MAG: tyrosine-protein phosphatase [Chloracidobacterium sp.]|nr:tyrosine-protein phosphatase [Chloracidobacterium sp.]
MTYILKRSLVLSLAILLFCFATDAQTVFDSKDLPNLSKVNEKLYRGGQPTEAGIDQLKRLGIKTVINLRDNDDRARKEECWAKAAGLRFINFPLSNWFSPKDEDIKSIIDQIDRQDNQPVYVHCKRGSDRTGTVVAVYRITHDGWTGKQANAEAKKFGFGWWQFWMKNYIGDYYRDYQRSH